MYQIILHIDIFPFRNIHALAFPETGFQNAATTSDRTIYNGVCGINATIH